MSLVERLADRATARALQVTETAVDRVSAVGQSIGASSRLRALMDMKAHQPLSVEGFVVLLVKAARGDEAGEISEADVLKAAKRRQRRLGALGSIGGPTGRYIVSLYCEVAILCDVERGLQIGLSDEELAGHLMVLWRVMPDHGLAMAAITQAGQSVVEFHGGMGGVAREVGLGGESTKQEALGFIWRLRSGARATELPGSTRFRDVALPGSRAKDLKAAAVRQLTS